MLARAQRALMLRSIPLSPPHRNTITEVSRLEQETGEIRSTKSPPDAQEFLAGVACVRRPVHGPKKLPVGGAGGFGAPLAYVDCDRAWTHIRRALRSAANEPGCDRSEQDGSLERRGEIREPELHEDVAET